MRFGGVAAAIVCESFTRCAQVGQHCGALSFMPKDALRSGAARRRGQRLLGRAALFLIIFYLGLAEELRPRRPPGGGLFVSCRTTICTVA
jgi:hypothetical protein